MSGAIAKAGKVLLTAGIGALIGFQLADFERDRELSVRLDVVECRLGIKREARKENKFVEKEKNKQSGISVDSLISDDVSKDSVRSSVPSVARESFSELSDSVKRERIAGLVEALKNGGGYEFPVLVDNSRAKESFGIGNNYFEFGAERNGRHHFGVDIYGFGKPVLAFRKGVFERVCRYVDKFDFGNILVINHGLILGDTLRSFYLHVGGISENLKQGDSVRTGQHIALTDCIGIAKDDYSRHIVPGSSLCKMKAHLHFQLVYGDCSISPLPFFDRYSKYSLDDLYGSRLALRAGKLSEHLDSLSSDQRRGSHAVSVDDVFSRIDAEKMYKVGAEFYHGASFESKLAAYNIFDSLAGKYESDDDPAVIELVRKAKVSARYLEERWLQ